MGHNKKCSKCGEIKHTNEFNQRKASKDGFTSRCTQCLNTKAMKVRSEQPEVTRARNLKKRFNMTIDEYNTIFLGQKGKCAICEKAETNRDSKGSSKWLCVDHNHNDGTIRGLLCSSCNTGIGQLGDSVKTLKSAIEYLIKRGSYGEN